MIKSVLYSAIASVFLAAPIVTSAAVPALNDKAYFSQPSLDIVVFSNWYNGLFGDSKISGVELVHFGERIATNGDVRLSATPEQWDPIPTFVERKVDNNTNTISATLSYPEFDFTYTISASPIENGVEITLSSPRPVPAELVGKAGFNMEFLPANYIETSFLADGKPGTFPLYPTGVKEIIGQHEPAPLASAKQLVLAPESNTKRVMIESSAPLTLYDGRAKAQNGWYVVRGVLPENKQGELLTWRITASTDDAWLRDPMIAHSQVGYLPGQTKRAVIELDKHAPVNGMAELLKVNADGSKAVVKKAAPGKVEDYTRYQYATFDFTDVTEPGLYQLRYKGTTTASFPIAEHVLDAAWYPTLDHYFPVQMDHVLVNEAYRVWHGASHLDDALQAPVNHEHFDLYAQGPTTDTQYKPGEHIPGLNVGGWYDAGDYDIRTQTQYRTVRFLVQAFEEFGIDRDTTLVDYDRKYVDIHVPDGKPDLLQQIEHGTLALLAQFKAVGHAIPGIIVPDISQYTHLGDGLTMTDNLIYNASMADTESNGIESGVFDDRWAFTSKSTPLNYGSMAALAAASRTLQGYKPVLAKESLDTAIAAWASEADKQPDLFRVGNTTGGGLEEEKLKAAVELLVTTGDTQYKHAVTALLPHIEEHFGRSAVLAIRALPFMDNAYKKRIRAAAEAYKPKLEAATSKNPFGVVITEYGWAGNGTVLDMAVTQYYLHQAYPDLYSSDLIYRSLDYLYGTHPDSDISFVSNVGTVSKKVAYGMNRADYSFISGAIVPGVLILKPDLPENMENWPFLWGENEYVIDLGASYLFTVNAALKLAGRQP
ncbi:glycoside hydrolase family 9 protein [Marisediminitalea aggregata]|uniref:glycoside hydrolase family 9 protein n=1 Tax=Marisediminitalea aggregata TaxID=634436 RepID=UPI0020CE8FFD|nr:glycoside hydrolase family 9 protein [Marisediminitalea aggregata]MCP9477053.1 glycoside hydrolase family 9 protein [Marisediminitalea aggregata]